MEIIPQIETPVSENYSIFEKNVIEFVENFRRNFSKLHGNTGLNFTKKNKIIIEQNIGINGIVICKDIKEKSDNDIDVIYAFNMRDKNRIAVLSDLTTLKQIGVEEIIISEGVHPLKTSFKAAKPVYDIDVLGFSSIIKNKGGTGSDYNIKPGEGYNFNLGVVVGASTPADLIKIKKLDKIGIDRFVINYSNDIDINIINYIKEKQKTIFIFVKEPDIKTSLGEFIKKASGLGVDGAIIKFSDMQI